MSSEPISDNVTLGNIKRALQELDKRRPQLPELYHSISIYPDGSGFVRDGQGREVESFFEGEDIIDVIADIKSK